MQEHILRAHRRLLIHLKRLEKVICAEGSGRNGHSFRAVLHSVQFGWLTPGKRVLRLMDTGKVARAEVLKQPDLLQRKWFSELDEIEKGRWLLNFANRARNRIIGELGQILDLTPRRLQQLLKLTKSVSVGSLENF